MHDTQITTNLMDVIKFSGDIADYQEDERYLNESRVGCHENV